MLLHDLVTTAGRHLERLQHGLVRGVEKRPKAAETATVVRVVIAVAVGGLDRLALLADEGTQLILPAFPGVDEGIARQWTVIALRPGPIANDVVDGRADRLGT